MTMKDAQSRAAMLAAAGLFGLAAGPASAELYEFTFGGEIDFLLGEAPEPWDQVELGDPFSVVYVFDSEAEDQEPFPLHGVYEVLSLTIEIGGAGQNAGLAATDVILFDPPSGVDRYRTAFTDLPIEASGDVELVGWSVFETDELPVNLELDDFDVSRRFEVVQSAGGFDFRGGVSTFGARVVPAPSALFMAISLMFGFGRRRRR
jgi:hypothetical protein